jgi:predicted RNA binding protein YcfA (HicA-like mRNA interferase family)
MKSMSGKELAKLLEANGWSLLRIQGSHHIYGKVGNDSRISVPIHRNQGLKIGLLRKLLKVSGLLDLVEGRVAVPEPDAQNSIDSTLSEPSNMAIDIALPGRSGYTGLLFSCSSSNE